MSGQRPCRGNTDRLVALLDGGLRPKASERLRAHLARCEACSEAYRRLRAAREALRRMGDEEPPDLNYRQVEAQIRWQLTSQSARGHRSGVQFGLRPAIAGLAAALLVGLAVGALLHRHYYQPATSTAKTAPKRPALATTAPGNTSSATAETSEPRSWHSIQAQRAVTRRTPWLTRRWFAKT